jgi:hypothetical protein
MKQKSTREPYSGPFDGAKTTQEERIVQSAKEALTRVVRKHDKSFDRAMEGKKIENVESREDLFWESLENLPKELLLKKASRRISRAADHGDIKFFEVLAKALKASPKAFPIFEVNLCYQWVKTPLGPGLCLCSDQAITDYFNSGSEDGFDISFDAVRKARQRLKLIKASPIIYRHFGDQIGFH